MLTCMKHKKLKAVHVPRNNDPVIRHLGTMLETMNDNIMLLAEGQGMLFVRMDRIEQTLDGHTEMIGELCMDMTVVKEKLDQKADKQDLDKLEFELKRELAKKADKEDIVPLVKRVAVLEAAR